MTGKDITLYTHNGGANGWKVAFLLSLLGLTYESKYLDFGKNEQKGPEHVRLNPNGRIPTIIDHKNGDFILWESNAILEYLVEKYDTQHKFSVTGQDKYFQSQWLYFQGTGQGPYFGQAVWFSKVHPEKIQSAVERYQKEIIRVFGVLESVLSRQEWLVGGKMTIADISFIVWNIYGAVITSRNESLGFNFEKDFPVTYAWQQKLVNHPVIKKVLAEKDALATAHI